MESRSLSTLRDVVASCAEAWKKDHDLAMECWALQSQLKIALAVLSAILEADTAWSEAVRSGKADVTREDWEAIASLYRAWLESHTTFAPRIKEARSRGFAVTGADEYLKSCAEVRVKLVHNLGALAAADRELSAGKGTPLAEVVRELQRRAV